VIDARTHRLEELRAALPELRKKARHAHEAANPWGRSWEHAKEADRAVADAERELRELEKAETKGEVST